MRIFFLLIRFNEEKWWMRPCVGACETSQLAFIFAVYTETQLHWENLHGWTSKVFSWKIDCAKSMFKNFNFWHSYNFLTEQWHNLCGLVQSEHAIVSHSFFNWKCRMNNDLPRAGLTIGQTGQMPGASRFWGPRVWISKHCFTGFSCFYAVHHAPKLQFFDYCVSIYQVKETDNFGVYRLEWLKRIEPNGTTLNDPRIR